MWSIADFVSVMKEKKKKQKHGFNISKSMKIEEGKKKLKEEMK